MSDILQVQGINSKGFGTIAKIAMTDRRLTPQAKAIYAYFCSYAGAGRTAFPQRDKILADLGISKDNYYKHLSKLTDLKYIKIEQDRQKGRFTRNLYVIMSELPCPCLSDTVTPCTVEKDIYNKQDYKINSFNNYQSSQSVKETDGQDRTEQLKANISYSEFVRTKNPHIKLIDEFIRVMVQTLSVSAPTIRISGEDIPKVDIADTFLSLDYDDIEYVIERFMSLTEPIKNKRLYIRAMLYNAKFEKQAHMRNGGLDE